HGLREVDLVLRSGGREERRVLEKLDGQARIEQGSQGLDVNDPFLRRVFLPVSVTVEARDNDELEGGRWGASAAITLVAPELGAVESAGYKLVAAARGAVVDLLAWLVDPPAGTDAKSLAAELAEHRHAAANALRSVTQRQPGEQGVPSGLASFLLG